MAPASPEPVAADVDHDAAEPLLEAVGIAKRAETAPGQNRGVVSGIFGLEWISEDKRREPVGGVEMAVQQCGALVSPGVSLDEPFPLNRKFRGHRPSIPRSIVALAPHWPSTSTDAGQTRNVLAIAQTHGGGPSANHV